MPDTESHLEAFRLEAYKQGSDACRNYSRLTALVRVIAIVGVVGAAAKIESASQELGWGLIALAFVLTLVDWHYQSAFTAIRDQLARLEISDARTLGPWCAHLAVRTPANDHCSSYAPFVFLALAGVVLGILESVMSTVVGLLMFIVLFTAAFVLIRNGHGKLTCDELLKQCRSKPILERTLDHWCDSLDAPHEDADAGR